VELEKLCTLQCTDEELAALFNLTTRTIERRRKRKSFAEVMARGKAKGRISVRRMQMKLLENGNATMGVWLGKNILGQTDEAHHQFEGLRACVSIALPSLPALRAIETDRRREHDRCNGFGTLSQCQTKIQNDRGHRPPARSGRVDFDSSAREHLLILFRTKWPFSFALVVLGRRNIAL
jgi:hypothetical protein